MPRSSFIIDLRFDGGRQAEETFERIGRTGDRSMKQVSQASQPARRGLLAVDDASRAVQGSVDEMAERLGPAGAALRALGPAGTAAAAAIATTTAGLAALTQRAPEANRRIAELGEQADQLGVSVQALQELRFAASQVGVEESRLEDGLQELNSRLGELRNEAGPLANTLEEMDARGLQTALRGAEDTEEAFQILIDALRDGDNTFDNAALAAAGFGEEAGRAIQRLANRDLPALRQEFRDTGAAFDEDMVDGAQEARREIESLNTQIQNNADAISQNLLPVTRAWKEEVAELTGNLRDLTESPSSKTFTQFLGDALNIPELNPFQFPAMNQGGGSGDGDGDGGTEVGGIQPGLPPGLFQSPDTIAGITTPGVPTPGTRPETPADFRGGAGGGSSEPLSFAGINFGDRFTMDDAIAETIRLNQDLGEQSRAAEQDIQQLADTIRSEAAGATGEYAKQLTDLNRAYEVGAINQDTYRQRADQLAEQFTEQANAAEGLGRAADQLGFTFSSAFEDAIINGERLSTVLQGLAQDIARIALRKAVTEPAGNFIADAISGGFSLFSGGTSTGGAAVPSSQGGLGQPLPTFAQGGIANRPSIFGEAGPEAAVPLPNGREIPVRFQGGGTTYAPVVNVTVQGAGGSDEERRRTGEIVGREVERAINRKVDARIRQATRPGGQLNRSADPI
jgi:hypothetical protein